MEGNDVLEKERVAHKEELVLEEEKERRELDWSAREVKRVFVQVRPPLPTERMEEEWVKEGEEERMRSFNVSVPDDVMVQREDVSDVLSVTVKDSTVSD